MTQVHLSWDRLGMQQTCSCMYAVSDNIYSACSSYPRIILGWTRTPTRMHGFPSNSDYPRIILGWTYPSVTIPAGWTPTPTLYPQYTCTLCIQLRSS